MNAGIEISSSHGDRSVTPPTSDFKVTRESSRMLQEFLINKLNAEVERRFLNTRYKGIDLCKIIEVKMYWQVMNDPDIGRMFRSDSPEVDEQLIDRVISRKISQIKRNPIGFPFRVIKDIAMWFRSKLLLAKKAKKASVDVVVPVNQKKYFPYTGKIVRRLEEEGKVVMYYVFGHARHENNGDIDRSRIMVEARLFPEFWNPAYYQATSVCRSIDKVLGTWLQYQPKKAMLVEGDTSILHVIGFVSRITGCETNCLQWGSIGTSVPKTGWRNMPFDRFLAWGEFFRESVEQYNRDMEVLTVGHPNIDNTVRKPADSASSAHDQQNTGDKEQDTGEDRSGKIILFAVQKIMKPFINEEDLDRFINTAVGTARQMPEYTIRIRSHPNYPIPDEIKQKHAHIRNIQWHDYFSASLDESLKDSLVCVTISSTLSFEALNYGALPVFLKVNNIELYLHKIGHLFQKVTRGDVSHVAEPDDIVGVIRNIDALNLNSFEADYFFKETGEKAVNAIAAVLTGVPSPASVKLHE